MTAITNYEDRTTCPLFGDAVGAVLLEPAKDDTGIIDSLLFVDGIGTTHLNMKGGGSVHPASCNTIENKMHYVYQEGQVVFKHVVSRMADVSVQIMERNNLTNEDINWLVPHQANIRIIEAVGNRMGLPPERLWLISINMEIQAQEQFLCAYTNGNPNSKRGIILSCQLSVRASHTSVSSLSSGVATVIPLSGDSPVPA